MATINVNMYVPVTPAPAPALPLWTQDGTFASAVQVTHTRPSGTSSESDEAQRYYVAPNSIEHDGNLVIYIPTSLGSMTSIHQWGLGTWSNFIPDSQIYFTTGSYTDSSTGISYNTYSFYEYADGEPIVDTVKFSFLIS